MIKHHRTPDGRNLDVDYGPGPVGTVSSGYQRAMGAVLLRDAVPPKVEGWSSAWDLERNRRNKELKREAA